jgi:hypothetical protein
MVPGKKIPVQTVTLSQHDADEGSLSGSKPRISNCPPRFGGSHNQIKGKSADDDDYYED